MTQDRRRKYRPGPWQSTHWLGKWRGETEWEVGLVDMDFKFDEQTIQMSILGLTGMKTHLQSSGHKRKGRERERERLLLLLFIGL